MLQSAADPWGSRRAFGPPGLVGARSSLSVLYTICTFVECVQRSALLLHRGHWSVSPTLNVLYKCCFNLLWFVLSLNMTTCSYLSSWLYASALFYFGCSNFHFRLRHNLMIVFSSEYVVESICSRCAPCLARVSASSLPLRPQRAGIHYRVELYLLDRTQDFIQDANWGIPSKSWSLIYRISPSPPANKAQNCQHHSSNMFACDI